MFINITRYKSKKSGEYTFYIYKCSSERVEGKVQTRKDYYQKIDETTLLSTRLYYIFLTSLLFENDKKLINMIDEKLKEERLFLWNKKEVTKADQRSWYEDMEELTNGTSYKHSNSLDSMTQPTIDRELYKEVLQAGYRAMSKKVHPDIIKDNGEKMQKLNDLRDNYISLL